VTPRLCALALVLAAATALTGCVTGERPKVGAPTSLGGAVGQSTGNALVDRVLQRLETAELPPFTARYRITRKFGSNSTDGTVAHDGSATAITVGDVRFVEGPKQVTCSLTHQTCEDGTLDARISDYSVSSSFYDAGPARALRVAYTRRSGEPTWSDQTIGGVAAGCVTVPVGTGSEIYCATEKGPLAKWDTAAIDVVLTGFQDTPDQSAFAVPGG
jgi:hypothetical protein